MENNMSSNDRMRDINKLNNFANRKKLIEFAKTQYKGTKFGKPKNWGEHLALAMITSGKNLLTVSQTRNKSEKKQKEIQVLKAWDNLKNDYNRNNDKIKAGRIKANKRVTKMAQVLMKGIKGGYKKRVPYKVKGAMRNS